MHDQSKSAGTKPLRTPTLVVRILDHSHIAVRFEQIGDRKRFGRILQRFRADFLLANCQEIEGMSWWVIDLQQQSELNEFSRRNGLTLKLLEDS
jgi:hypothetical protein